MRELRTVSSLFDNMAAVVRRRAPRAAQAMMGARWSFAWPWPAVAGASCEYSLPADYALAVARRSGLHIVEHAGREAIDDRLAANEVIVVAVDTFHLVYRPAFGRVHSGRTILVRAGRDAGEVWIEDHWEPAYQGPLNRSLLEGARHSLVPHDPILEPIFSGRAIDGEWYSVSVETLPIPDPRDWAAALLRELCSDGRLGIAALRRFQHELRHDGLQDRDRVRVASLVLRAELSTRIFLCAWLRAASNWLSAPTLRTAAASYHDALGAMQIARDLLAKSLTHPRLAYYPIIFDHLTESVIAEERLAAILEQYY